MAIYRIKNITNLLDRRHLNHKTVVDLDYNDQLTKKTIKLGVGETKYIEFGNKPLSLQKLIMKGFVTVEEISKKEAIKITTQPKVNVPKKKPKITVDSTTTTTRKSKKKS